MITNMPIKEEQDQDQVIATRAHRKRILKEVVPNVR